MNTYTGGTDHNVQDNGIKGADAGENLFLSGGFDSFGGAPEPANTGMEQLGSIDYSGGYGNVDQTLKTNPWANQRVNLNLWGQLFNSFLPFKYDRYIGLSEGAAKDFVKFFIKMYLVIGYLLTFFVLFQLPGVAEFFKSGHITILLTVIILGAIFAVSAFLGPYLFRLQAFIYRLIFGNLLMAVERKEITSTNMYLVSIYACVPWMMIRLLFGAVVYIMIFFMPVFPQLPPIWVLSLLELIMPAIIMAVAIPRME